MASAIVLVAFARVLLGMAFGIASVPMVEAALLDHSLRRKEILDNLPVICPQPSSFLAIDSDTGGCGTMCDFNGGLYSCRARVEYLRSEGNVVASAIAMVNKECSGQCSCANSDFQGGSSGSNPQDSTTIKVMSYNTEFNGYPGHGGHDRVGAYGAKIREVNAAVVGVQECQDAEALAQASGSGYSVVPNTGGGNNILYKPASVSLVPGSSGHFSIPKDDYAARTVTYAKFRKQGHEFLFFNTHMPHDRGEARDPGTHEKIGSMVMKKRAELQANDLPTILTADTNRHKAKCKTFGERLKEGGIHEVYRATGNRGGHGHIDAIFYSGSGSNGKDEGTGESDHPAISAVIELQR
jgi:endonuclease/exonuclease/phosphatase family metal-dependent hydrolase